MVKDAIDSKLGFYNFQAKYQGMTEKICPAPVSQNLENQLRSLSLQVHNALRLEYYSRQDFIVDRNDNIYCLESNSRPGMTKTSVFLRSAMVAGINFNELCEKIIEHAINRESYRKLKNQP